MKNFEPTRRIIVIASSLAILTTTPACTATGPLFVSPDHPPSDQAQVIFYRNSVYQTGAIFTITADGQPVGRLRPDGWFSVKLPPGELRMAVKDDETKLGHWITLEPGKVTYLRLDIDLSSLRLIPIPMSVITTGSTVYTFAKVDEKVALKELTTLRKSD
jgi:hypothetical protein